LCRFVAIFDPPFPIIAGGPIQWGRISPATGLRPAISKLLNDQAFIGR